MFKGILCWPLHPSMSGVPDTSAAFGIMGIAAVVVYTILSRDPVDAYTLFQRLKYEEGSEKSLCTVRSAGQSFKQPLRNQV